MARLIRPSKLLGNVSPSYSKILLNKKLYENKNRKTNNFYRIYYRNVCLRIIYLLHLLLTMTLKDIKNKFKDNDNVILFGDNEMIIAQEGPVRVLISIDDGLYHLSMSCVDRIPTYWEIKDIRYKYLPDNCHMAQIFPPQSEFINVHPYTLHLFQLKPSQV